MGGKQTFAQATGAAGQADGEAESEAEKPE
jgi:hypothetical protein